MDSGKSDWHPADIIASLKKRGQPWPPCRAVRDSAPQRLLTHFPGRGRKVNGSSQTFSPSIRQRFGPAVILILSQVNY